MANDNGIKKTKGTDRLINPVGSNQANDGIQQFAQDLFPDTQLKKQAGKGGGVGKFFKDVFKKRTGTGSPVETATREIGESQARIKELEPLEASGIGPKRSRGKGVGTVFEERIPSDITRKSLPKEVDKKLIKAGIDPKTAGSLLKRSRTPTSADLKALKPGESIGNFSIAQAPVGGVQRGKKGPSVFSQKGIESLFGSAADLAKLFASKEFQERKASGIRAGAGLKAKRADTKAKTEQIKAESGLLKDLVESGADESLIKLVQDRLRERFKTTASSANEDQLLGIDRELNRG